MNYELIKKEFIELKKEELWYLDRVAKICSNKDLKEYERLEIYVKINNYQVELREISIKLLNEMIKNNHISINDLKETIIEFDIDKSYFSSLENEDEFKRHICNDFFGVDLNSHKYKLTLSSLIQNCNEYKEQKLLEKINELYKKVKGEFIKEEVLYSGHFLNIIKETYRFPNNIVIEKEKVVKNSGKNSVIIVAITQDNEYIITFQNRIKRQKIAEFPSGYIENGENPIDAAKRELQEETGYISDDLFVVDEAFSSPGIDNSSTYIVIANDCIKTDKIKTDGTELIKYGLFSEIELKYLINTNIMSGALNKLAYYNLINNTDMNKKRINKKQKKLTYYTINNL